MTMTNNALVISMADRFGVDKDQVVSTLMNTAFRTKEQVTVEQVMSLMIVANQYGLNPWLKEIYAYPSKNGIIPIVGVDGWSRIINEHPQFDGLEFEQDDDKCTCIIFRKDRSHPTKVSEYYSECKQNTGPWSSHPKRMLRHKSLIQCARLAFGYVGIFDEDEADRIRSADPITVVNPVETAAIVQQSLPAYPDDRFNFKLASYADQINSGKPAQEIIDFLSSKYLLSSEQIATLNNVTNNSGE